jgi:hypothetical protein
VKKGEKWKKLALCPLFVLLLAFVVGGFAIVPASVTTAQVANNVKASFHTAWNYESPEDTFINSQVTGRKWWQVGMMNSPDETGASVNALTLRLESTLAFDILQKEHLVTSGPPAYEWSFGDVPEQSSAGVWVDSQHDSNAVPVTFTPGFDSSRSLDETEFTAPSIQTLTITLTPREMKEGFTVLIQAEENEIVNPVITYPASGAGIYLTPDGHSLHIDPTSLDLNTTWTIDVAIQVTPKVPEVTFMPYVLIGQRAMVATGSNSGEALSSPVGDPADDVGTWTLSAVGTYEWYWEESLSKQVIWVASSKGVGGSGETAISTSKESGNRIDVGFMDEFIYEVSGNTFTNSEVIGKRWWRTNFANWPDGTGAPAIGVKVMLESELAFDEIERDKLTRMGPPVYEWYLGDVVEEPERQEWPWDAFVGLYHSPTEFSPGVDVSRSFDKTVFTAADIQTMTVTLTSREEWVKEVSIFVHTDDDVLVNPVIVSISHSGGGEVFITEDGHRSGVERIPVEFDTPLTITYTLQVTPKVAQVEYWPVTGVLVYRPDKMASGTSSGRSVSYTNEAGTWTWSAEGDYYWQWGAATPDYAVSFEKRVEQPIAGEATPTSPVTVPDSTPETSQTISWQFVIGLIAGVIVVGSVIYFFIRTRRKRAS